MAILQRKKVAQCTSAGHLFAPRAILSTTVTLKQVIDNNFAVKNSGTSTPRKYVKMTHPGYGEMKKEIGGDHFDKLIVCVP